MVSVESKIKAYIDERHIQQNELAAKTGISACKLNLSLNGKRRMTFAEYQAICWVLGVGVDEFMAPCPPSGAGL